MNFLFGKKKPTPPQPTKAIDKLREALQLLERRGAHLGQQIDKSKEEAKKYLRENNKTRALNALKRSKLLEKELESIEGQKFNLEAQISALTQAITNSETMAAMRLGKDTLVGMEMKVDADKVAETMEDISESIAKMEEVTDAMARPLGPVTDEDDLLAELDGLSIDQEKPKEKPLSLPSVPSLPSLPSVPEDEEDVQLRELQAVMNA
jgi:charged multivesicular body protein 6